MVRRYAGEPITVGEWVFLYLLLIQIIHLLGHWMLSILGAIILVLKTVVQPACVLTPLEECDAYSAVVEAITAHNAAATVGEALWSMDDQPEAYVVVEAGTQPDPADAPKPTPTLEERLATVESAQADADALNVDQAYRLTLLELGITE